MITALLISIVINFILAGAIYFILKRDDKQEVAAAKAEVKVEKKKIKEIGKAIEKIKKQDHSNVSVAVGELSAAFSDIDK